MKKRITLDFETRSCSELKKEGAYKYSLDPTTRPTCLAIKVSGKPDFYFLNFQEINRPWMKLEMNFRHHWLRYIDFGYEFSAHNAFFERCIYENILVNRYGWPTIPLRQYRCTAAKAAACALPRNLEGAGHAMNLLIQKDKRGYAAMMMTCKPTKAYNAWKKACAEVKAGKKVGAKKQQLAQQPAPKLFLEPDDAPDVWQTLYEYCKIDTHAEECLDDSLPDLIPLEQEIWFLNQELNWRGLRVDISTIKKISGIMEIESKKKLKELDTLTMGLVTKPNSVKSIMSFLELEGVKLPNLRKETVEKKLNDFDLSDDLYRLLELRKALSLTSLKKYQAFLNRACDDGRVRDICLYHAASTGRSGGVGINFYNFPRGLIRMDKSRPYATVENVVECDHEMLKVLYGDSLGLVFSAILRNMVIPSKGCELFVADFSKIEVAVLWWLAGNIPGLKILTDGKDPYIYQAAANAGKNYEDFSEESPERQLGKAQVLGCGFGMGINGKKFQATAANPPYNLKLTLEQSIQAVKNYREANPTVPALWKAYEAVAVQAVECPGHVFRTNHCKFFVKDKFLWIELPSSRRLAYREPRISWRETEYGPRKSLQFHSVNSKTKQWGLEDTWGGTITENIVQATARDLMLPAMMRLKDARYRPLSEVYDEGICERKIGEGNLKEFTKIMCETPSWAVGCPIEAKGWKGMRYRK